MHILFLSELEDFIFFSQIIEAQMIVLITEICLEEGKLIKWLSLIDRTDGLFSAFSLKFLDKCLKGLKDVFVF